MARDTTQQNQRGARSSAQTSNARKGATSRTAQSDRQTPIQTGRESGTRSRNATPSSAPVRGQGENVGTENRQSGSALSAPVRGNDPFALMRRMQDDMDQLFGAFGFGRLGLAPVFGSMLSSDRSDLPSRSGRDDTNGGLWSPQIETFRRGNQIVVRADLPGVNKDDVSVNADNGVLTISGERSSHNENESDGWYRTERSYGSFYRALPLPEGVDGDACDATFKDGVLEVTLPAPSEEKASGKRVPVK